jgi:glucosamine 6-phosphate synthetase-like amidotransferase/phosphosugar isomerase protein
VIIKETSTKPELPGNLKKMLNKKEKFEKLPKDLKKVKDYIFDRV